jgi:hypothetical protein
LKPLPVHYLSDNSSLSDSTCIQKRSDRGQTTSARPTREGLFNPPTFGKRDNHRGNAMTAPWSIGPRGSFEQRSFWGRFGVARYLESHLRWQLQDMSQPAPGYARTPRSLAPISTAVAGDPIDLAALFRIPEILESSLQIHGKSSFPLLNQSNTVPSGTIGSIRIQSPRTTYADMTFLPGPIDSRSVRSTWERLQVSTGRLSSCSVAGDGTTPGQFSVASDFVLVKGFDRY